MVPELTSRVLFDTSVYVTALRSESFARTFRPRYLRDIPRTHMSSVVVEELLAGARTPRHRQQAGALCEPFERVQRIVTPSHLVWKEAGTVVAALAQRVPNLRDKLAGGLLNDILIALSGRAIGATVVTLNGADFALVRRIRAFGLEVIPA